MTAKINLKLIAAGAAIGIIAIILAITGNPKNMAFCIACFIRDTAGALKLHTAAPVQYMRPEIAGILAGSLLISIVTREFKSTAGSAPVIRFFLGFSMVVGALVFLGCPLRMVIRMAAGDLNAYVALIGFVAGVLTGVVALKKGFTLGRTYESKKIDGAILPLVMFVLCIAGMTTAIFAVSTKGPGSQHAPALLSLAAGIAAGVISQRARTCFAGALRDIFLAGSFDLFSIIAALFVTLVIFNVATGSFHLSFANQPVAHSQHLWSILGMYAVGLAAVLAGGCPLRQTVLAGQGSADSAITFVGMLIGAACAHNFGLAGAAASATSAGGIGLHGKAVLLVCIAFLLVVAFTQKRTAKK